MLNLCIHEDMVVPMPIINLYRAHCGQLLI